MQLLSRPNGPAYISPGRKPRAVSMAPLRGFAFAVILAPEPESIVFDFWFLVDGQQSNTERKNHWIPDRVRYDRQSQNCWTGVMGRDDFDCHSGL